MTLALVVMVFQIIYFLYFMGINTYYILLNISALFVISRHVEELPAHSLARTYSGLELPVTIIVPAYNEEKTIAESLRALQQLHYPEYEIVVVNDGSRDATLDVLVDELSLTPYPEAYRKRLDTQPIRGFYRSAEFPNVRVIDKENGGKSDALNAGINLSQYPLFCCIDADSLLSRDSMMYVVRQFLDDPRTIACGGTIRVANGCEFRNGFLVKAGLSRNLLARIQTIEYLRAFLFGRLGWVPFNALLIISGSFSVFRKEPVIEVGGYSTKVVGEDMELVVRLHKHHRINRIPYIIAAVPEPICYTEVPEDMRSLRSQRVRWQRGLAESLAGNLALLYHPRGGWVGWLAFPFSALFEWFGPILEMSGYVFFVLGFFLGVVSYEALMAFLLLSVGFSLFVSIFTIILEEISFHVYPKASSLWTLLFAALLENIGFRQINAYWRFIGLLSWLFRTQRRWGQITRRGTASGS